MDRGNPGFATGVMLNLLTRLPPESSHALALKAIRHGLVPRAANAALPRLACTLAGLDLPNPIGLAAGADKHLAATQAFLRLGFGHLEVGGITPTAQTGNPRPRLFRLRGDAALINRMGLNNDGARKAAQHLANRTNSGVVGLNIAADTASTDPARDYAHVTATCGPHADYLTINVSCPNQDSSPAMQSDSTLVQLLDAVEEARQASCPRTPLFIKLSPDLSDEQLRNVIDIALDTGVNGFVATNTTRHRPALRSPARSETGGLSGAPLFARSTRILARVFAATRGTLPIIGVGGITSPADAIAKIRAGATVVQLYTALTYQGIGLLDDLCRGIDTHLRNEKRNSVREIVGLDHEQWLT